MATATSDKQVRGIGELITDSVNIVLKNWKLFLLANFPIIVGTLLSTKEPTSDTNFAETLTGMEIGGSIAILLVVLLVALYFYAVSFVLTVRLSQGRTPSVKEMFVDGWKWAPRLIVLAILVTAMVVGGFILIIIPGLIIGTLLMFAGYILVDKNTGIIESITKSFDLVSNNVGKVLPVLLIVFIVLGLSVLLPSVDYYIGNIVATVVSLLTSMVVALRYAELKS